MHIVADLIITIAVVVTAAVIAAAFVMYGSYIVDQSSSIVYSFAQKLSVKVKIVFCYVSSNYAVLIVKNIGKTSFTPDLIKRLDVFFGKVGQIKYIPYITETNNPPYWNYTILNDYSDLSIWNPGETVNITIVWDSELSSGDYMAKIVTYTGYVDTCHMSR